MSGGSKKTTTQQSTPWAPAVPALKKALSGAQNAYDTTYNGPSVASQTDWTKAGMNMGAGNAYDGMTSRLAGQAGASFGDILGNGGLSGQQQLAGMGMLGAMGQAGAGQGMAGDALAQYASGSMLGENPYLTRTIGTAMQDAADGVNSQFSGAGRYGSGAHEKVLGDRLGNIATAARMQDYNQQQDRMMSAANSLGGLSNSSLAANIGALGQYGGIGQQGVSNIQGLTAGLQGLNTAQNLDAQNLMGLGQQQQQYNQSVIDAANQDPWTKAGNLAQIAGGIGGMGGTTVGTQKSESGIGGVLGGITSGLGAMKNLGVFSMFSDERVKEDIKEVGELKDGQPVYAYNYKDDPTKTKQIGLLAQEVEKRDPDAVGEVGGVKTVEYGRATAKAAKMSKKRR